MFINLSDEPGLSEIDLECKELLTGRKKKYDDKIS